jgi:O-antigen/teichoic acid export membrane protein
VTARISGSETIGIASTIASITLIIATIVVLDTRLGMKRYMGIAISTGDIGVFKQILTSVIIFVSVTVTLSAIIIAIPNLRIMEVIGIDREYSWIVIALIPATAFGSIFAEALIAAQKARKLVLPLVIGSIIRFPILFGMIYVFNSPATGVILAYSAFLFVSTAFYSVYLANFVRKSKVNPFGKLLSNLRLVITAGLASWVPHMLSVLGSQLAIVSVFSLQGAAETGKFYLPMAIFTFVQFIVSGINRVSHPLIAGMPSTEQQVSFVSYNIKLAFLFTMPIAAVFLFYGGDILRILGTEYGTAHTTLAIFMLGMPFTIITEIIYYFVYGRGNLRSLLYLGLAGNIPRIVLYFTIIPLLGLDGAAWSYLAGTIAQLILSISIARGLSLPMHYKSWMILTSIPLFLGLVTLIIYVPAILSSIIVFFGSLLSYVILGLFTDSEIRSVLYLGLPRKIADKIYPVLSIMVRKITRCDMSREYFMQ